MLLILFVGLRLFTIHYAFLILIATISILIIIRSVWYFRKCAPYLNKLIDVSNDMYQTLEDNYRNINFIKLNNLEEMCSKSFLEKTNENKIYKRKKYLYDDKYYAFVMCMSIINRPLNFILGGILLYCNKITLPVMLVVFDYSSKIINMFSEFHHVSEEFNDFLISSKRINNLVNLTKEDDKIDYVKLDNYDVFFKNVTIKLNDKVILKNSDILIMDEVTSNLDLEFEQKVMKATREVLKNKFSFIIAHRLKTIKNADIIIYIKDGVIKELGTHD